MCVCGGGGSLPSGAQSCMYDCVWDPASSSYGSFPFLLFFWDLHLSQTCIHKTGLLKRKIPRLFAENLLETRTGQVNHRQIVTSCTWGTADKCLYSVKCHFHCNLNKNMMLFLIDFLFCTLSWDPTTDCPCQCCVWHLGGNRWVTTIQSRAPASHNFLICDKEKKNKTSQCGTWQWSILLVVHVLHSQTYDQPSEDGHPVSTTTPGWV